MRSFHSYWPSLYSHQQSIVFTLVHIFISICHFLNDWHSGWGKMICTLSWLIKFHMLSYFFVFYLLRTDYSITYPFVFIGLFDFAWFLSSYIVYRLLFCQTYNWKVSSLSLSCLFTQLPVFFVVQKSSHFMMSCLSIVGIISQTTLILFRKSLPMTASWHVFCNFFSN